MAGGPQENPQTVRAEVIKILGELPTTEKQGKALSAAINSGNLDYAKKIANIFKEQQIKNGAQVDPSLKKLL